MTDDPPKSERSRTLRISIRIGETVAVLGLLFGIATFMVGRSDRAREEAQQRTEKAEAEQVQARASTLVLKGEADGEGTRILLTPADPEQVIQTQRYTFPRAVREATRQISAGQPQIDRAWIADGLKREERALRQAGVEPPRGDRKVPVAIDTTYVHDGETRTDRGLYRVGYRFDAGLLGRSEMVLLGVSRIGRAGAGELQPQVDRLWTQGRPASRP